MTQAGIIEAVVQVGAQETRYLRCGRGERVVVVLAGQEDERLRLMGRYAAAHCVIAPIPHQAGAVAAAARESESPAAEAAPAATAAAPAGAVVGPVQMQALGEDADALEQWLRGVIDGLGLDVPAVLLAPEYAWLAERLACGCGDVLEVVRQDG